MKNTEVYELAKEKIEEKFQVPERIEDKVWNDIEYNQNGLVLSECRPHFQKPEIITKLPIFKLKFNPKKKEWLVYWMPSDGKWHSLKSYPKLDDILQFIDDNGEYFWG